MLFKNMNMNMYCIYFEIISNYRKVVRIPISLTFIPQLLKFYHVSLCMYLCMVVFLVESFMNNVLEGYRLNSLVSLRIHCVCSQNKGILLHNHDIALQVGEPTVIQNRPPLKFHYLSQPYLFLFWSKSLHRNLH